ncbi:MAG TPA: hypothetical protein VGN63_00075 [Flavisolibacter sp.]|jgi:hypothetical protein|nr:hypothetical protein [Flavisolibacter sp.]
MKKISLFPLFALLLAVGASAFTEKNTMQQWHLIPGKSGSQLFQESSYQPVPSTPGCDNTDLRPCVIQFDTQQYSDLQEYLDSFNGNEAQLIDDAVSTRTN